MRKTKKQIILKGEGVNNHTLVGDIRLKANHLPHDRIVVNKEGLLKHEQPDGSFAEHNTLIVDKGNWIMGEQVEYNPLRNEITRIWD